MSAALGTKCRVTWVWSIEKQRRRSVTKAYEGGCLCGASRYIAHGDPINVRVCHCRLCQRAIGAAFNARALFSSKEIELTGPIGRNNSSAELVRGFCTRCGTTLFSERGNIGVVGITIGSFDDPNVFRPAEHIWTSSKQAWVKLDDGLPQYEEGFPG
jgi:hypothetical protein